MITAGVLVAPPGVAPHKGGTSRTGAKRAGESSTPSTSTPFEPVGGLVEDLLGSGQDHGVGNVPVHPQGLRDAGHRHGLKAQGPQPPLDGCVGQPRPRLGKAARVLSRALGGSAYRPSAARAPPAR